MFKNLFYYGPKGQPRLNPRYHVLNLNRQPAPWPPVVYSIGRYNEVRPHTYPQQQYQNRCVHMGVDIGAPIGAAVHLPLAGQVILLGLDKGFGPSVLTEHPFKQGACCLQDTRHNCLYQGVRESQGACEKVFYILWAHLSFKSWCELHEGQRLTAGQVLARVGGGHENAGLDDNASNGWVPHVHVQLLRHKPKSVGDVLGVVSERDQKSALQLYPDPRCVLGPLYVDE